MLDQTSAETQQTTHQQTRYVVHLPVFEGPLDLLLHLIEKRQMEITTISLMAVTDQYLAYLQHYDLGQAMLANMAAFLSIAARLLFIKSQSLLPSTSKEETNAELQNAALIAEDLRRHLLEYKLAKEIALHLRQREEVGLQTYTRSGLLADIQVAWTPPTLLGMEPQSLAQTFQRLLELRAKDEVNSTECIPPQRVRLGDRIAEIVARLSERSSISLSELLENEHSRLVIIVTFLAVLEMWKRERISVRQDSLFGSICLERGVCWAETEANS